MKQKKPIVCCFCPVRPCLLVLILILIPILIIGIYASIYDAQYIYIVIASGCSKLGQNFTILCGKNNTKPLVVDKIHESEAIATVKEVPVENVAVNQMIDKNNLNSENVHKRNEMDGNGRLNLPNNFLDDISRAIVNYLPLFTARVTNESSAGELESENKSKSGQNMMVAKQEYHETKETPEQNKKDVTVHIQDKSNVEVKEHMPNIDSKNTLPSGGIPKEANENIKVTGVPHGTQDSKNLKTIRQGEVEVNRQGTVLSESHTDIVKKTEQETNRKENIVETKIHQNGNNFQDKKDIVLPIQDKKIDESKESPTNTNSKTTLPMEGTHKGEHKMVNGDKNTETIQNERVTGKQNVTEESKQSNTIRQGEENRPDVVLSESHTNAGNNAEIVTDEEKLETSLRKGTAGEIFKTGSNKDTVSTNNTGTVAAIGGHGTLPKYEVVNPKRYRGLVSKYQPRNNVEDKTLDNKETSETLLNKIIDAIAPIIASMIPDQHNNVDTKTELVNHDTNIDKEKKLHQGNVVENQSTDNLVNNKTVVKKTESPKQSEDDPFLDEIIKGAVDILPFIESILPSKLETLENENDVQENSNRIRQFQKDNKKYVVKGTDKKSVIVEHGEVSEFNKDKYIIENDDNIPRKSGENSQQMVANEGYPKSQNASVPKKAKTDVTASDSKENFVTKDDNVTVKHDTSSTHTAEAGSSEHPAETTIMPIKEGYLKEVDENTPSTHNTRDAEALEHKDKTISEKSVSGTPKKESLANNIPVGNSLTNNNNLAINQSTLPTYNTGEAQSSEHHDPTNSEKISPGEGKNEKSVSPMAKEDVVHHNESLPVGNAKGLQYHHHQEISEKPVPHHAETENLKRNENLVASQSPPLAHKTVDSNSVEHHDQTISQKPLREDIKKEKDVPKKDNVVVNQSILTTHSRPTGETDRSETHDHPNLKKAIPEEMKKGNLVAATPKDIMVKPNVNVVVTQSTPMTHKAGDAKSAVQHEKQISDKPLTEDLQNGKKLTTLPTENSVLNNDHVIAKQSTLTTSKGEKESFEHHEHTNSDKAIPEDMKKDNPVSDISKESVVVHNENVVVPQHTPLPHKTADTESAGHQKQTTSEKPVTEVVKDEKKVSTIQTENLISKNDNITAKQSTPKIVTDGAQSSEHHNHTGPEHAMPEGAKKEQTVPDTNVPITNKNAKDTGTIETQKSGNDKSLEHHEETILEKPVPKEGNKVSSYSKDNTLSNNSNIVVNHSTMADHRTGETEVSEHHDHTNAEQSVPEKAKKEKSSSNNQKENEAPNNEHIAVPQGSPITHTTGGVDSLQHHDHVSSEKSIPAEAKMEKSIIAIPSETPTAINKSGTGMSDQHDKIITKDNKVSDISKDKHDTIVKAPINKSMSNGSHDAMKKESDNLNVETKMPGNQGNLVTPADKDKRKELNGIVVNGKKYFTPDNKDQSSKRLHLDYDTWDVNILDQHSCLDKGKNLNLIIGVFSYIQNFETRKGIRETWAKFTKVDGIKLVFFVGLGLKKEEQKSLEQESKENEDVIQISLADFNDKQTEKSIMFMKWLKNECPLVKFVLKTNDNVFLNMPHIHSFVMSLGEEDKNILYGKLHKNVEKQREANTYPDYLSGEGYLFSGTLASELYKYCKDVPIIQEENIFISGTLAEKLKIPRKDIGRFSVDTVDSPNYDSCDLFESGMIIYPFKADEVRSFWEDLKSRHFNCGTLNQYTTKIQPSPKILYSSSLYNAKVDGKP